MKRLKQIPAIHKLKKDERFLDKVRKDEFSEAKLTELLIKEVENVRIALINGEIDEKSIERTKLTTIIFKQFFQSLKQFQKNNLQRVVNATGVVLHTNLGRAPLSKQAILNLTEVAERYSTLEYNICSGKRGSRHHIVEQYLMTLTGAEAGIVVNNNAAAVYFVLKALGSNREAIVSRGELVEIGGSFRISDIMNESNVQIIEIGTTNKTNLSDYEKAVTEQTAMFLKVHKSNFKMIGFTEEVDTASLVPLSQKYNIPIYEDLGSGTLFNFKEEQIGNEPTVSEKINEGVDIISFSGDKLLGGPQAGIIVGKKKYIDQLKQHQLARVLRVDKFTLATLEATLKTYLRGREREEIPVINQMLKPIEMIEKMAYQFINTVQPKTPSVTYNIMSDVSKVGGGTMPEVEIETKVVKVVHDQLSSEKLAKLLRNHQIPIIVRMKDEAILLDFRTVEKDELNIVIKAFLKICER